VRRGEDVARRGRGWRGMFGGHFRNCKRRREESLTFLLI
jgi:hypothetical protein